LVVELAETFVRLILSGKVNFSQSQFLAKVSVVVELAETQVLGFGVLPVQSWFQSQSRACKNLWRV
jgi:hypothetical protein